MKVSIEYCVVWDYQPKAASLAAAIEARFKGVKIEMVESSGGVFEIVSEGKLIYSKKATGRHPTHEEILDALNWEIHVKALFCERQKTDR